MLGCRSTLLWLELGGEEPGRTTSLGWRAGEQSRSDGLTMPGTCTIEEPSFLFCFVLLLEGASCSGRWGRGFNAGVTRVLVLVPLSLTPSADFENPLTFGGFRQWTIFFFLNGGG